MPREPTSSRDQTCGCLSPRYAVYAVKSKNIFTRRPWVRQRFHRLREANEKEKAVYEPSLRQAKLHNLAKMNIKPSKEVTFKTSL